MRNAFAAIALFALVAGGVRAADVPSAAPPDIHIYSCKVLSGPTLVPLAYETGLAVRFMNNANQPYTSILWRAKYADGYVDFLDQGTFSPQIRIDNFVLSEIGKGHVNIVGALLAAPSIPVESDVHFPEYASLDDPENCQILEAVTADGAKWTNSSVTPEHYLLPAPFPSTQATLAPGEDAPHGIVDIAHCQLEFPWSRDEGKLDIGYRITSPARPVDAVTFRVSYGRGTADVTDLGSFGDGGYVRHALKVPIAEQFARHESYFSLDDPKKCVTVSVRYADGSQWANPEATAGDAPTPVPDALDRGLTQWIVKWQNGLALPAPSPSASANP